MNPKTIQQLKESSEFRELVAFLASEVAKLDDLSNLEDVLTADIPIRYFALVAAKEILDGILGPLLGDINTPTLVDPKEYVVE